MARIRRWRCWSRSAWASGVLGIEVIRAKRNSLPSGRARSAAADAAQVVEVDLVPDYKILHDAGYNVLAYDLRNHGLSSAANGGVVTHGFTESRDVVGSLEYCADALRHPRHDDCTVQPVLRRSLHVRRDEPLSRGLRRCALPRVAAAGRAAVYR